MWKKTQYWASILNMKWQSSAFGYYFKIYADEKIFHYHYDRTQPSKTHSRGSTYLKWKVTEEASRANEGMKWNSSQQISLERIPSSLFNIKHLKPSTRNYYEIGSIWLLRCSNLNLLLFKIRMFLAISEIYFHFCDVFRNIWMHLKGLNSSSKYEIYSQLRHYTHSFTDLIPISLSMAYACGDRIMSLTF